MVTINELQVENLKRVKAVRLEPSASGLTVIGGRNGQPAAWNSHRNQS